MRLRVAASVAVAASSSGIQMQAIARQIAREPRFIRLITRGPSILECPELDNAAAEAFLTVLSGHTRQIATAASNEQDLPVRSKKTCLVSTRPQESGPNTMPP